MNPPRTFPKKTKKPIVVEDEANSKRDRQYNDKNMSEHDKAVGSLGKLFSYYNDRCTDAIYQNPDI